MRKLILQMQISIDGYASGPNGELDWMIWNWDDELNQFVGNLTETIGTILLGRKMADGFISHWSAVSKDLDHPEYESGIKFTSTPKVVFSSTLKKSEWENTILATGDLSEEINKLKSQRGQDIIVYGGVDFVSSLFKADLIDQLYLFVNPVVLGGGKTIFKDLHRTKQFSLVDTAPFPCGVALLRYESVNNI